MPLEVAHSLRLAGCVHAFIGVAHGSRSGAQSFLMRPCRAAYRGLSRRYVRAGPIGGCDAWAYRAMMLFAGINM